MVLLSLKMSICNIFEDNKFIIGKKVTLLQASQKKKKKGRKLNKNDVFSMSYICYLKFVAFFINIVKIQYWLVWLSNCIFVKNI